MYRQPVILFALVCASFGPVAHAADDSLNVEITPFGAYRFGGSFEVTDSSASYEMVDSPSYGLIINLRHQANTQWEVFYSRQSSEAKFTEATTGDPIVDIDIHILQAGGTYQGEGDTVRPYLAATIGGTHIKTRSDGSKSDTFFSGSIGVGLQVRPNDRLGIRLEARAYGTLTNSDTSLFCQTGPDLNVCAVRVDGDILGQFETFAGIVFRF